jgi:hypothetical protein
VVFEFDWGKIGASWTGIRGGSRLAPPSLVSPFEVGIEVFEAQGQQHASHEGDSYSSRAIGFRVIAHRHRVIVIVSS